uniref:Uncharacterized protein n=1 Tax=Zea mays TaxID=4577 RepID=B7ZZC1_MAIZE|nr:unknown [Zea mays]
MRLSVMRCSSGPGTLPADSSGASSSSPCREAAGISCRGPRPQLPWASTSVARSRGASFLPSSPPEAQQFLSPPSLEQRTSSSCRAWQGTGAP